MADQAISSGIAAAPTRPRDGERTVRHGAVAGLLVAPATFLIFLLLIGPVIAVVGMSFTDYQLGETTLNFVGLANYREMIESEVFWKSLANTLIYVAVVVPVSVFLGLGFALLIQSCTIGKAFYRAVYFLPVMATLVAMAIVWSVVLNPDFGLLNLTLRLFGIDGFNWLNDPGTALLTICGIGVWQALGFNMVLFMAGLGAIPRDLYDAAEIDGAAMALDRFRTVTWPLLGPVTMFVVVITGIRSFQVFDTVHVLTKGGPNKATEVLIYSVYAEGFEFFRSAYAATLVVVFLVFVMALTVIKARVIERRVHYG